MESKLKNKSEDTIEDDGEMLSGSVEFDSKSKHWNIIEGGELVSWKDGYS